MSNNLRISGGQLRGIRLSVKSNIVKPTSENVRQSLFNIIDVRGTKFLDVFAGSGIVGIEAISRGADFVCFIEKNYSLSNQINQNLSRISIEKTKFKVINSDWKKGFDILENEGIKFNIIFLDPFYNFEEYFNLVKDSKKLLEKKGTIILEASSRRISAITQSLGGFDDIRTYGDTSLVFITYGIDTSISNQNS
ncbi:MAG: 16S rRNA (guanine(966)-N(2))-methyltransferase RsmD [Brevinematia bacterium]